MLYKNTLPKLLALVLMSAFIFLWASSEVFARAGGECPEDPGEVVPFPRLGP
jgi:hypothetical protein